MEVIGLSVPGLAKGKKSGSLKWEMSCALGCDCPQGAGAGDAELGVGSQGT